MITDKMRKALKTASKTLLMQPECDVINRLKSGKLNGLGEALKELIGASEDPQMTIKAAAKIVFKGLSELPHDEFWAEVNEACNTEEARELADFLSALSSVKDATVQWRLSVNAELDRFNPDVNECWDRINALLNEVTAVDKARTP